MIPRGDGDGWARCAQGHKHWGIFGAAGLLLRHDDRVLLQHRALWSHHGGTWGILGGARNSGETAVHTAAREAAEEAGFGARVLPGRSGEHVDDHGGWSYVTVVGRADRGLPRPAAHGRVAGGRLGARRADPRPAAAPRLRGDLGDDSRDRLTCQRTSAAGSIVIGNGSVSVSTRPGVGAAGLLVAGRRPRSGTRRRAAGPAPPAGSRRCRPGRRGRACGTGRRERDEGDTTSAAATSVHRQEC